MEKSVKYEFSIPIPTSTKDIDYISRINKEFEKSKITSFYFALPNNSPDKTGFEQLRTIDGIRVRLEDWQPLVEKSCEGNFDVIYLLNSPSPLYFNNPDFEERLEKLDILIKTMVGYGCTKFRISNPQLLAYLIKNYPNIELYASTSFELKTLKECQDFIKYYPQVKQIVPSHDTNKNFKFLKSLRQSLPDTEIELLANEFCLKGCPFRHYHPIEGGISSVDKQLFARYYYTTMCSNSYENIALDICLSNGIFPWNINEYGKIGIYKFKLVGRDNAKYQGFNYYYYIKGIDNFDNIKNITIDKFMHRIHTSRSLATVSSNQIRRYLPKIEYFKKHGHKCTYDCGVNCNYCYKCAEKMKKDIFNHED